MYRSQGHHLLSIRQWITQKPIAIEDANTPSSMAMASGAPNIHKGSPTSRAIRRKKGKALYGQECIRRPLACGIFPARSAYFPVTAPHIGHFGALASTDSPQPGHLRMAGAGAGFFCSGAMRRSLRRTSR